MEQIRGKTLSKVDGSSAAAAEALAGKELVLFYFSAHWCPPCKHFTPILKDFYEVITYFTLCSCFHRRNNSDFPLV